MMDPPLRHVNEAIPLDGYGNDIHLNPIRLGHDEEDSEWETDPEWETSSGIGTELLSSDEE
jgi:hypothetical protein